MISKNFRSYVAQLSSETLSRWSFFIRNIFGLKRINIIVIFILFNQSIFGQNLFNLIPPEVSGIEFNNIVTDEKQHNILLYSNYYGGAGVGIGDFDNDGLQDIFFAGNLVNDRLYKNLGNLKFEDRTVQSGILEQDGWSSGVVLADVNNDSWLDIYITRELYDESEDKRRNLFYLNDGDGTFTECATKLGLDNSERTRHATFLDFNNDGLLDLYLLNQPPNPGNYSAFSGTNLMRNEWAPRLLQQQSDGQFSDVTAQAGILAPCYPNSVSASDFNKDGFIDIYVANDYDAPDMLWKNNGDGTFSNIIHESHKHISYYSMGVDAADINNDSQLDIMTLDMVAEDNYRLKANMSGMNPERFWELYNQGGHRQYMFNNLNLNQGEGHFSDIAQLAGVANTDWSWSNLIADFDNDGWKDIHITNGLLRDIRNTDAAKSFPNYIRKIIKNYIEENPNEGDVDIFEILNIDEALSIIPSVPLKNFFYLNNGDLTFTNATDKAGLDQPSFSNGSAYGDLDNDGDLDLVVNNINSPAFLYENKSNSNYLRIKLNHEKQPIFGSKVEVFFEDQKQFYEFTNVRGMYSTSENVAHFGLGELKKVDSIYITWPDGTLNLLKDVESNQELTVSKGQSTIHKVYQEKWFTEVKDKLGIEYKHIENQFDDYHKQVLLPHKMSNFGPALATGDVNLDGLVDVFIGGAVGQKSMLFLQNVEGYFNPSNQPEMMADSLNEDMDAIFVDIDNDNDLDLYVVSGGNAFPPQNAYYQDRIYVNDGKGGFTKSKEILPVFRESGSVVKPFDLDNDGDLDLFVGGRHNPWDYPTPSVSRLLINEGGKYIDGTKSFASDLIQIGMVTDAKWSDYDQDGDTDLIVVGEWMGPKFLNNKSGRFAVDAEIDSAPNGWLFSIESADLDNDGDDDYIIGNLGLNYKYKASQEEPFEIFYSDFDQNGSKDIVLSYYNYGERFPLRGRSCSAEQVPQIKEKFENYDLFASSNLETVYGEESLDAALHFQATDFRSGVLINNGTSNFTFIPFPNEAQLSSINDIVVIDLNNDGHLDLITSGNLYSSEIETTRNDAGIGNVLLGNSTGHFTNKPCGLYIDKDSKKLTLIKNAEGNTFIISANNDDYLSIHKIEK